MIMEKIKELCKTKRISVCALEKGSSLSHGTIARWDKMNPKAESLYKVSKFLQVPMEYFFEGE